MGVMINNSFELCEFFEKGYCANSGMHSVNDDCVVQSGETYFGLPVRAVVKVGEWCEKKRRRPDLWVVFGYYFFAKEDKNLFQLDFPFDSEKLEQLRDDLILSKYEYWKNKTKEQMIEEMEAYFRSCGSLYAEKLIRADVGCSVSPGAPYDDCDHLSVAKVIRKYPWLNERGRKEVGWPQKCWERVDEINKYEESKNKRCQ